MMTYQGYTAVLEVDAPSGVLVGHVLGTRDEIVFQGRTVEEARASFHATVDFYLQRRAAAGQEPDKPFSGRFNVRIDPAMHRGLVLDAEARKLSLNDVVKRAFAAYLARTAVREEGGDAGTDLDARLLRLASEPETPSRLETPRKGRPADDSRAGEMFQVQAKVGNRKIKPAPSGAAKRKRPAPAD
jgi:predicted HicB family RNase H-like nuclease